MSTDDKSISQSLLNNTSFTSLTQSEWSTERIFLKDNDDRFDGIKLRIDRRQILWLIKLVESRNIWFHCWFSQLLLCNFFVLMKRQSNIPQEFVDNQNFWIRLFHRSLTHSDYSQDQYLSDSCCYHNLPYEEWIWYQRKFYGVDPLKSFLALVTNWFDVYLSNPIISFWSYIVQNKNSQMNCTSVRDSELLFSLSIE